MDDSKLRRSAADLLWLQLFGWAGIFAALVILRARGVINNPWGIVLVPLWLPPALLMAWKLVRLVLWLVTFLVAFILLSCGAITPTPDAGTDAVADVTPVPDADPGRPLGAPCATDGQCANKICARDPALTTGQCCTGRPSACVACTLGYLGSTNEGLACGNGSCSGKVATNYTCRSGICTTESADCAQRWCAATAGPIAPGDHLACAASSGNVCVPDTSPRVLCACLSGTGSMPYEVDSTCP